MRMRVTWVLVGLIATMTCAAQDSRPRGDSPPTSQPEKAAETQPTVDDADLNPLYRNWAQFKPGSFAKLRTTTDAGGRKSTSTVTFSLKEVTAEKAVIEVLTVITVDDKETRMPPQLVEHLARFKQPEAAASKPTSKTMEGNETIQTAGKHWKCRWTFAETERGELHVKSKTWTSDDVPGMSVKAHTETSGIILVTTDTILIDAKADRK